MNISEGEMEKIKIHINEDEVHPVYSYEILESMSNIYRFFMKAPPEITIEEKEWIDKTKCEYEKTQVFLRNKLEGAINNK